MYLCICISVFACHTPGNIVFEVLVPLPFQKYITQTVFVYLFICVFVYLYLCVYQDEQASALKTFGNLFLVVSEELETCISRRKVESLKFKSPWTED